MIERKTPDAGAFAALLTVSGETGGRTTVVAGTVAGGEPRITRLDDYRLDMAPADIMLITRHLDRPGTVGRVGMMLGEADVNISAMHLARTRAARGRVHDPGARRRRAGRRRPRRSGPRRPSATCGRSGSGSGR